MKQEKEFDRSICFTFYNDFHEQIMDVKRDFGIEQAFEVYEAIANYGLYGIEIEKGMLRTLVGNSTIAKVENSQENRSKWFKGENFEQTKVVAEYMRDHPEASQRTIAAATGVGKTKVGKVQKNIRESGFNNIKEYLDYVVYPNLNNDSNSSNDSDSNNYIVGETETDQRDQSELSNPQIETASPTTESTTPTPPPTEIELSEMDIYNMKCEVIKLFKKHMKPQEIVSKTGYDYDIVNDAIDYYMDGYKMPEKPKEVENYDIKKLDGTFLELTREKLFNTLTNDGTNFDIDWADAEFAYINMDIPPFTAKQLVNEFKEKLQIIYDTTVLQRVAN